MSSKYALSVSLTEHLCAFIQQQVGSGRYSTASEVVRTALRLLEAEGNRGFSKPAEGLEMRREAPLTASAASGTPSPEQAS
jgi:putative addiction module CopG family antidote